MLTEPATVVAVTEDRVLLQTSRKQACGKCSLRQGCGQYLLGSPDQSLWLARDCAGAEPPLVPGTTVQLGLPGSGVLRLALLFYCLPLALLLLSTLLASTVTGNEGWLAFSALAGLVAGFRILPVLLRALAAHPGLRPRLSVNRCTSG